MGVPEHACHLPAVGCYGSPQFTTLGAWPEVQPHPFRSSQYGRELTLCPKPPLALPLPAHAHTVPACSLSCPFQCYVSKQGKYKLIFTLVLEKQTQKVSSFHSSGRPRELAWMVPCFSGQMNQCRRHLPP